MPSTPANAMRISNPPNPASSTSRLSIVGMRPTRDTAIVFILPVPNGMPKTNAQGGHARIDSKHLKYCGLCGAPGQSRTADLLVRSQTLYPAELRAHTVEGQLFQCTFSRGVMQPPEPGRLAGLLLEQFHGRSAGAKNLALARKLDTQ